MIHQLKYTHEQYSAFLPLHQCYKKLCSEQLGDHLCYKDKGDVEGECDFVIVGDYFVGVFEVKGLSLQDSDKEVKYEGCCVRARVQRKRMKDLIKSIDPFVMIYDFTVFPNISSYEVEEQHPPDQSILYKEDIDDSKWMIGWFADNSPKHPKRNHVKSSLRIKHCLLGLWGINDDNRWDLTDCSLSKCISDIDEKLRRSLVSERALHQAKQAASSRNKRRKNKKPKRRTYPQNMEIVEAEAIFQDYLGISCLTKYQLELFNNEERFVWVEGPAGTGKTVVMLGKIIYLALNTTEDKRILLISHGYKSNPAIKNHLEVLNNINQDITCAYIEYDHSQIEGDIGNKLEIAHMPLREQLAIASSKIVLTNILDSFSRL